jgi:hypothetical protein
MSVHKNARLMIGHNNFTRPFVMALLAATPESQLAKSKHKPKTTTSAVTREQVTRLERELASLQMQTKGFEETYGLDNLHLTVAKAYLAIPGIECVLPELAIPVPFWLSRIASC